LSKTGDEVKFDAFTAAAGAEFRGTGGNSTTLDAVSPTNVNVIHLPDASGTVALTSDITATIADTDDVPEGTNNKYFTVQRVNDALDTVVVDGTGIQTTYNGAQQTFTIAVDTTTIATRAYVDSTAQGLDVKASVRAATTAALAAYTYSNTGGGTLTANANGALVIDGVNLAQGNRVLVKNESGSNEKYNGLYSVATAGDGSTPWELMRTDDANSSSEVTAGLFTFVEEGTTNADCGFVLATNQAITLNTTALTFTQFSGAGAYTAGNGLTSTGTTFNVGAGTGIVANANDVAIDTAVVVRKYSTTITPANPYSDTVFVINHALNTQNVQVTVYDTFSGGMPQEVVTDIYVVDNNNIDVVFAVAPTSGQTYKVVVQA
jgi:hypothetical protein